jgi:uncharacterized protein (DUF427 family)
LGGERRITGYPDISGQSRDQETDIAMREMPRENVQTYPRPPALEQVPWRVLVRLGGQIVAETTQALRVLETHHAPSYYLPPDAIKAVLRPVRGTSFCEWKGNARYFDVVSGGVTALRAAWAYDRPDARFAPLAGYVAFYAGKMEEAWVGDLRVQPQPGDFYGGWVTSNLDGQIKGAPGTRHW